MGGPRRVDTRQQKQVYGLASGTNSVLIITRRFTSRYLGVLDFDAPLISKHPGPFTVGRVGEEAKLVALAATALRGGRGCEERLRVLSHYASGRCPKGVACMCVFLLCGWA